MDLQKELVDVTSAIEWIQKNPPTMDYLVEYSRETKRYEDLKTRKAEIEALLRGEKATVLEQEAAECRRKVEESFDRCDTDGFLSQWAGGLTAQLKDRQARIERDGGMAEFYRLNDLAGNEVPAKLINGKFGLCWALVDEKGSFTGTFISAHPARESTMTKKGYREVKVLHPAVAVLKGSGYGLSGNCWVAVVEKEN